MTRAFGERVVPLENRMDALEEARQVVASPLTHYSSPELVTIIERLLTVTDEALSSLRSFDPKLADHIVERSKR